MTNRLTALPHIAQQDRIGGPLIKYPVNALETIDGLIRAAGSPLRKTIVTPRKYFGEATAAAIGDTKNAIFESRPVGALVAGTFGIINGATKDLFYDALTATGANETGEAGSVIVRDAPRRSSMRTRSRVNRALTNYEQPS